MNHYRKTIRAYRTRQDINTCPFCSADTLKNAVFENSLLYIVPNLTKYDLWELHDVSDHLLIVPKRHVESMTELTKAEKESIMDLMSNYEADGYNIYARGVGFVKRSVKHLHIHLIKVSNKKPKIVLFIQKPYVVIKK